MQTWTQYVTYTLNTKEGKTITRLMRKSISTKLSAKDVVALESAMRASGDFDEDEITFMKAYINQ